MFDSDLENIVTAFTSSMTRLALDEGAREALGKKFDIELEEWMVWQDAKARAHAMGWIDSDNSMYIYRALGEEPATFNEQPLEVKVVLTQFMAKLLNRMTREKEGAERGS